jgi:hypothetical protein
LLPPPPAAAAPPLPPLPAASAPAAATAAAALGDITAVMSPAGPFFALLLPVGAAYPPAAAPLGLTRPPPVGLNRPEGLTFLLLSRPSPGVRRFALSLRIRFSLLLMRLMPRRAPSAATTAATAAADDAAGKIPTEGPSEGSIDTRRPAVAPAAATRRVAPAAGPARRGSGCRRVPMLLPAPTEPTDAAPIDRWLSCVCRL